MTPWTTVLVVLIWGRRAYGTSAALLGAVRDEVRLDLNRTMMRAMAGARR